MRVITLFILGAGAMLAAALPTAVSAGSRNPEGFGIYSPEPAVRGGRRIYRYDPRSWYYAQRGYYPYYHSGYWVPRAVAFERRIAAAVADPGVWDVATPWTRRLPAEMLAMLDDPAKKEPFDRIMRDELGRDPKTMATLAFRMRPYGLGSPFEVYRGFRELSYCK